MHSQDAREAEDGGHGNHHAHSHDQSIASFSLIRETPLPHEALQLLLTSLEKHLGANLLRVKGLVNVVEEPGRPAVIQGAQRSEEHTSELQSLMRISYAVFCLTKKKQKAHTSTHIK